VEHDPDGRLRVVRGPHNIVRRIVEFACEHPELDIYLGSPAEIVATLYATARETLEASRFLFSDHAERLPVWQRPSSAADAQELVSVCEDLALPVSERTAHRILGSHLSPLDTVLSQIGGEDDAPTAVEPDIYRDRRGLKIHHTDLARFKQDLARAFDELAERYYVHLKGEPKVTVTRDGLRVRFDVDKEE